MANSFPQLLAADPSNPDMIASNAEVVIFAPGDNTRAPLALTTLSGLALSNPLITSDKGFTQAFIAPIAEIAWATPDGKISGVLRSYQFVLEQVAAAIAAASGVVSSDDLAAAVDAKRNVAPTELGTEHLDTIVEPDVYSQSANLEATVENGYPITRAGLLTVEKSAANTMVWQSYKPYVPNSSYKQQEFRRQRYQTSWSSWQEIGAGSGLPEGGAIGQVVTKTATGAEWASPGGAAWDADKLAIARGYHEVFSNVEPSQVSYVASNGQSYPVVWVRPILVPVPVLPDEPFWYRNTSTFEVADLVGIEYRVTSIVKDGVTIAVNYLVAPATLFNLSTVAEAVLPYRVKVEAFAKTGYELPLAYAWFYDFPDPNGISVITSDTFGAYAAVEPVSIASASTDALLGGSPKPMVAATGMAADGGLVSGLWRVVAANSVNLEVEFDVVRLDAGSGDHQFELRLANKDASASTERYHNTGIGVNVMRQDTGLTRIGEGDGQSTRGFRYGPVASTIAGHWKISVVQNTLTVTGPGAAPLSYTLAYSTVGSLYRGGGCQIIATNRVRIDNIVVKQVGF